ncbi:thiamine phosphate synthase [Natronospira bacteriovora]|uniref:Thiamine-phosphate synthase n=1 Tax=Natronospira bacteriovora TaxID=3069753 RepID=A0ABU0W6I6_9GAMM|nr:thiamine phosphate synthase [Natronospira sp. AB-CW4]MDQ2069572.1 thiamine phosphate synthase [Natronospira sp. AB-CW4]
MNSFQLPCGIYVLTDHDAHDDARLLQDVQAALNGGAALVQFRDKSRDTARRERRASRLLECCRAAAVPLVINDDPALCARVGADGLHLGRDDGDLARARDQVGPNVFIGQSCYNELTRAEQAAEAGADYVAFGSVFPSATKPDAVHAPLPLLELAGQRLSLPVCAIGGINRANIDRVAATGAQLAAVIGSVWSGDPEANVQALSRRFEQGARL